MQYPSVLVPPGSTPSLPTPPLQQPHLAIPSVPAGPVSSSSTVLREDGTSPYSPLTASKRNPSDPYVPADPNSTKPSRSVLIAAAYRKNLANIDLTGRRRGSTASTVSAAPPSSSPSTSTSASASLPPPPIKALRGKPTAQLPVTCATCSTPICRITLRGGCVDTLLPRGSGTSPSSYSYSFRCLVCAPLSPPPPQEKGGGKGKKKEDPDPLEGEARYESMISGAVDRYLGIDPEGTDTRPKPAGFGKVVTGFVAIEGVGGGGRDGGAGKELEAEEGKGIAEGDEGGKKGQAKAKVKKRSASEMGPVREGLLVCDVCNRDLATGHLTLALSANADGKEEKEGKFVTATAEVVCGHCEGRYMRCSDCGGGGAGKGVGRWRCKELFVDGRKTCLLSHARPPPVTSMEFDVHPLPSFPPSQLPSIIETCQRFFFRTAFLTAAIPELIESPSPIARSFDELENIAVDLWSVFEDVIRSGDEAEGKGEVRRYLAFYWAPPPTQSKKPPPPAVSPSAGTGTSSVDVLREDKVLSGLILAEHDLPTGNLHLCFHLPFSVGEAGLALGRLTQVLCVRAQKELDKVNETRVAEGKEEWPKLATVWTVRLNKRDSRLMSRATRRDWTSLDEYLAKHPDVDPQNFPPYRKMYLTPDLMRGWCVYASRVEQRGEATQLPQAPEEDLGGLTV